MSILFTCSMDDRTCQADAHTSSRSLTSRSRHVTNIFRTKIATREKYDRLAFRTILKKCTELYYSKSTNNSSYFYSLHICRHPTLPSLKCRQGREMNKDGKWTARINYYPAEVCQILDYQRLKPCALSCELVSKLVEVNVW